MSGPKKPRDEAFWSKVDRRSKDECWPWMGTIGMKGYGQFAWGAKGSKERWRAHRLALVLTVGPLPPGAIVMHACDNPSCVNPYHLSAGTIADNNADRMRKGRHRSWQHDQTHCLRGHPFDEQNTRLRRSRGGRECRTCQRERYRLRQQRSRAQRTASPGHP